jgi:Ca2+-binding EF-hand superfamily protein
MIADTDHDGEGSIDFKEFLDLIAQKISDEDVWKKKCGNPLGF